MLVLAATAPATATVAPATATAPTAPAADAAAQGSECSFPVELTDQSGTNVTVEEEPSRVVTLNPSAAQTMWEIGAKDKVVGVTKHAMNLEGAEAKTNISAGGQTISNEKVVGLEPDLVLAPNTIDNETVQSLRDAGLTVYHFGEAGSIAGIQEKTRIIGELTGECAGAEETVDWMDAELATVDAAVEGQERPGMIYTFFGWTAGNGTFIGNLIERAGARNVAAEAGIESYQELNDEVLVDEDPDWILRNSDNDQVPKTAAYNGTTAVQEDQIVVVNYNQLNRPAPRVIYPLVAMTKAMHPEAYAEANATESATATATDTDTASPTDATTESSTPSPTEVTEDGPGTGASGPGFTAVGALVALVSLSLLAGRRGT